MILLQGDDDIFGLHWHLVSIQIPTYRGIYLTGPEKGMLILLRNVEL